MDKLIQNSGLLIPPAFAKKFSTEMILLKLIDDQKYDKNWGRKFSWVKYWMQDKGYKDSSLHAQPDPSFFLENARLVAYIEQKYGHMIRPYYKKKAEKNIVRKILKDPNIIVDHTEKSYRLSPDYKLD